MASYKANYAFKNGRIRIFENILLLKKIIIRSTYAMLGLLFGLLLLVYLIFNNSTFQNFIIHKAEKYLSDAFKTQISIGHINYDGWTYFSLDNIYWGDQKQDTLFFVKNLQFDLGGVELDSTRFVLSKVNVEGGVCKIITYPDKTFNINTLFNILDPNDTISDPYAPKFKLIFDEVSARNCRFQLIDSTTRFSNEGFDPLNELFYNVNLEADHFKIIEDSLNFNLRKLSGLEKSGIEIRNMQARTIISSTMMAFEELSLKTPNSSIGNSFIMSYDNWDSCANDFMSNVFMKGNLQNSIVSMKDVAFFAPVLKAYDYTAKVQAKLRGTVRSLKMREATLLFGSQTVFKGSASMNGLPDIGQTFIEVNAEHASTVKAELEKLIAIPLPQQLADLGKVSFKGHYTGFINDFVSYGNFETNYGRIVTDLNMKLAADARKSTYSGKVNLHNFDLGGFLRQKSTFGFTSLLAEMNGTGFDFKTLKAETKANISYFDYNGYRYRNISMNGVFDKKFFNGKLLVEDENVELELKGKADLNRNIPEYKFNASVSGANLKALHFSDAEITFSTNIRGDFTIKDIDHNSGILNIDNTFFEYKGSDYTLNHIVLASNNINKRSLVLSSDFMSAKVNGNYNFATLHKTFINMFSRLAPSYFQPYSDTNLPEQDFNFSLRVRNTENISRMFFPDYDVNELEMQGTFNSKNNVVSLGGYAETFRYDNLYFSDLTLKTDIDENSKGTFLFGISKLSKNDTLLMKEFAVKAVMSDNKGEVHLKVQDTNSIIYSNLNSRLQFEKGNIHLDFEPSDFMYKQSKWTIDRLGTADIGDSVFRINQFALNNGMQQLLLNGMINRNNDERNLLMSLTNFNLNNINLVVPSININFGGEANGNIALKTRNGKNIVTSGLWVTALQLDKDVLGDFELNSEYDNRQERLSFVCRSLNGLLSNFNTTGYVVTKTNEIRAEVGFDEAEVSALQALVKDYLTLYNGKAVLKADISGTLDKPDIEGYLLMKGISARIEYLKTTYDFSGNVTFDKNKIELTPFRLFDINRHTADVSGKINHNNFSNFNFALKIDNLKDFQVLNTSSRDNSLFHGQSKASGNVSITGPIELPRLDINLNVGEDNKVAITPFGNTSEGDDDLYHIINLDTTAKIALNQVPTLSGFEMNLNLNVRPQAEVQIVFDEYNDDKMKAFGSGNLRMELTRQGAFNMYGTYELQDGEYRFTALDVVSKRFELKKGTIVWNGNPMAAELNLTGSYKTRTTITELISLPAGTTGSNGQPTQNTQRMAVECLMRIKGALNAPSYSFDLDFPDIDNSMNGSSLSELNLVLNNLRKEPEQMTQQVISLMVLGKFTSLSTSQNQTANSSSNLGINTLSELASAKVTRLLMNAFNLNDFDVTVDMLNAIDPLKSRAVLISAQKKLFSNRVEVSGSIASDNSQNNFLAQYNINQNGNMKLRVFNRFVSADPIFNRNVTTSGIGFYYRKEFDSVRELFKKQLYIY